MRKYHAEYSQIFDNAIDLIESSKLIAKSKFYGPAISLLILALEELIKYQVVLYNTAEKKAFGEKEFSKVFSDHKTKHKLLIEYQEVFVRRFDADFVKYILKSVFDLKFDASDIKTKNNRFKEMGIFLKFMFKDLNLTQEEIQNFKDWLGNANSSINNSQMDDFAGIYLPTELTENILAENNRLDKPIRLVLNPDGTYEFDIIQGIGLEKSGTWKPGGIDGHFNFYDDSGNLADFGMPAGSGEKCSLSFQFRANQDDFFEVESIDFKKTK